MSAVERGKRRRVGKEPTHGGNCKVPSNARLAIIHRIMDLFSDLIMHTYLIGAGLGLQLVTQGYPEKLVSIL